MVDGRDPVVVGEPAALALADRDERDVGELLHQLGRAGVVEPAVERRDDRGRAVPRHRKPDRLEVRVDNVEPLVFAPDHRDGESEVVGRVAAIAHRPQALRHDRHQLAVDLRVAGGEERDLVSAPVKLLHDGCDNPLRAGVADRRYGEHGWHGDANPKRFHCLLRLPRAVNRDHGASVTGSCKTICAAARPAVARWRHNPRVAQKEVGLILMRQLASGLAVPTIIFDDEGEMLFYNEPAELLLGQRFDDVGDLPLDYPAHIPAAR